MVSIVVAMGHGRVIGKDNGLLWHLPDDLKHFKRVTDDHPVVMGRKTWESLPEKYRPLPNRTNIVVTRDASYEAPGAKVVTSIEAALEAAREAPGSEDICIIGGGEIYRLALPLTDRLYLTLVDDATPGTVTFPAYESEFANEVSREAHEENGFKYEWVTLDR